MSNCFLLAVTKFNMKLTRTDRLNELDGNGFRKSKKSFSVIVTKARKFQRH